MAGKSRPLAGSIKQPKSGSGNSAPASQEIVVTIAVKDHPCDQCGEELLAGDFQRPINDSRICLSCAKLDALEFLPRGDAAISRRAAKYSAQKIVVVKWSKARNRFERQGIWPRRKQLSERGLSRWLMQPPARLVGNETPRFARLKIGSMLAPWPSKSSVCFRDVHPWRQSKSPAMPALNIRAAWAARRRPKTLSLRR